MPTGYYDVPHETMLTIEYIAGFISSQGSFISYSRSGHEYFALQIKSDFYNADLLEKIAASLGIHNRVYRYNKQSGSYSLLVIRDRDAIIKTIIPQLDGRLFGIKNIEYQEWKKLINEQSSTWNYRKIKSLRSG